VVKKADKKAKIAAAVKEKTVKKLVVEKVEQKA